MPALAVSAIDVLLIVGLGAAGFLVVALVCVGVLAMLHLILPSTDAGAAAVDHLNRPEEITPDGDAAPVDTEVDA
ncbi:MAG: hypothetical protein ABI352_06560 [Candidatus Dormibacter sp.]